MYADTMLFIALTGGIASGKSTISRRLKQHGAMVLDADELARLVVSPGWPALEEITRVFGREVIAHDGTLDRAALASIVFADADRLASLNAIVHPAIRKHVDEVIDALKAEHPDGVLVYEIPLLAENSSDYDFDLVVVAEAPDAERVSRMTELRGMTEQEAHARLAHQASNEERRKIADVVIDTSSDLDRTLQQTDDLWRRIQALSASYTESV